MLTQCAPSVRRRWYHINTHNNETGRRFWGDVSENNDPNPLADEIKWIKNVKNCIDSSLNGSLYYSVFMSFKQSSSKPIMEIFIRKVHLFIEQYNNRHIYCSFGWKTVILYSEKCPYFVFMLTWYFKEELYINKDINIKILMIINN